MKIVTFSLGCKVNKYESESILKDFKEKGYEVSDKLEFADIYIINTCAVTSEAEKKSRQMIARCRKFNPKAKIFVCGCASQKDPEQFLSKDVKLVKGVAGKQNMISEIEEEGIKLENLPLDYEKMSFSNQTNTRAYLKVQDGCNNFCTYCIIPYLRGRSRSRDLNDILLEAKSFPEQLKEIVVVGIDVADFKIDEKKNLIGLLEELDKLGKRIRLSSLEDGVIQEDFVKRLSRLKNFCPQFHMSLQSGSNSVLKRMNRHYSCNEFEKSVNLIRKYFPSAGITTDVIVGFPGESDEEFLETKEFVKKVGFSSLHIFPYSHRSGTVASKMKDVDVQLKKKRVKELEEVDEVLFEKFVEENKKNKLSVLIEEEEEGCFVGHSKNFLKCYIKGAFNVGDILTVSISEKFKDGVLVKID